MILRTEQDSNCSDVEVMVRYARRDVGVERLLTMLGAFDTQIRCTDEQREYLIKASDILYIESVDRRTYVYLERGVFYTEARLYQMAEELRHLDFVQVSKACILNLNALESIRPLMNSRMEATLKNGEKIHINRKYVSHIKNALKGDC